MSSRRLRDHFLRAAVVAAALCAAPAAEAACARPAELGGLQARVLQTELMVAALSCGEADRYNAFVKRFRDELVDESKHMQRFFARMYGGGAKRELNSFVTALANNSSQRSLNEAATFCPQAAALLDEALRLDPKQLRRFAAQQSFADSHGFESCEAIREARAETDRPLLTAVKLPAEKPLRIR